ncbi:MAG: 30S ribosomal protein S2 [Candidatus Nanoarchaeia archaeon]|nr:30S ribosomal protein S2 [Candidatus Nanoarchaeia archaeon]
MAELLISNEEFLKYGVHIGTKYKTKDMAEYIYMTKPNGLSVMNIPKINEKILLAANMLSEFSPSEILFVSRRENGWKSVTTASKILGAKYIIGRYSPGLLTNASLENYTEAKIIFAVDPWPDANIIKDAQKIGIPVIAMCDTNNLTKNVDLVIPGNNKGKKSIGLVLYLLTKLYLQKKGVVKSDSDFKHDVEEFAGE